MRTDQEAVKFAEDMSKMDISGMNATHFHNMMFDIQKIYKKINEKLQVIVQLDTDFIIYMIITILNYNNFSCTFSDMGPFRKYD